MIIKLTKSRSVFVGEKTHKRSSESVSDLADEESKRGSGCVDYCGEEEEEVIEPAGSGEIIEAVTKTVGQDLSVG